MNRKFIHNHRLDNPEIRRLMNVKMCLKKVGSLHAGTGMEVSQYLCECGKTFSIKDSSALPTCFFAGCAYCTYNRTSGNRLYKTWSGIKARCTNEKCADYPNYGGRGISIDPKWDCYQIFEEWALQNGYEDGMTIERIDVDGNYEPDNCKWIPPNEQQKNRRITYNNRYFTYDGVTLNYHEWAARIGVTAQEFGRRVRVHGDGSEYVINPPKREYPGRTVTLNGETKRVGEWLKEYGISRNAFDYRLSIGTTPEQAITHKRYSRQRD